MKRRDDKVGESNDIIGKVKVTANIVNVNETKEVKEEEGIEKKISRIKRR